MASKDWLSSVQNELSAQRSRNAPRPFPKVLADMRRHNKKEYEPIFFTFGPYHAKLTKPLSPCDHFKLQAAKALTSTQTFSSLVAEIQERDSYIRDLYAEPWDNSPDLQEPEVLAHLLAPIVAAAWKPQVFQPQAIASAVLRDAFLLEHQIPFFVLKCAVKSIYNGRGPSLETIVKAFSKEVSSFCPFSPSQFEKSFQSRPNWSEPSNIDEPSMICCVYDILTSNNTESSSSDPACSITCISLSTAEHKPPAAEEAQKGFPTASQLLRSGITFERSDAPFGALEKSTLISGNVS